MVGHTCDPSTTGGRGRSSKFETLEGIEGEDGVHETSPPPKKRKKKTNKTSDQGLDHEDLHGELNMMELHSVRG